MNKENALYDDQSIIKKTIVSTYIINNNDN